MRLERTHNCHTDMRQACHHFYISVEIQTRNIVLNKAKMRFATMWFVPWKDINELDGVTGRAMKLPDVTLNVFGWKKKVIYT